MACRKRYAAFKRAWKRAVASARGLFLAVVGLSLLAAGLLLRYDDIRTTLVVLGVGVLGLGILLPLVGEFVLGPGGLTFKQAFRERDVQFRPSVLAEIEQNSLQRFARLLTGDDDRAAAVVEEALARTYRVWTDIPEQELNLHVLCALVRVTLGASKLHLIGAGRPAPLPGGLEPSSTSQVLPAPPEVAPPPEIPPPPDSARADDTSKTEQSLISLPIDLRAVLLLRHIQDLDESQIAWILDRPVGTVTDSLHQAEASLEEMVGIATAGSA